MDFSTVFQYIGVGVVSALFLTGVWVLWICVIWPFVEACSLCRWHCACLSVIKIKRPGFAYAAKTIWYYYFLGGRGFARTWNSFGEWDGVGNWKVYPIEDDE